MNSQAVARISLVITLIVAAHIIKPFSVRNVSHHLLSSTKSFVHLLPDSTRSNLSQANQLVMTLSHSLLEDEDAGWNWPQGPMAKSIVATEDRAASCSGQVKPEVLASKPATRPQLMAKRISVSPTGEKQLLEELRAESLRETNSQVEVAGVKVADRPTATYFWEIKLQSPADDLDQGDESEEQVALPEERLFNSSVPVVLPPIKVNLAYPLNATQPFRIERLWRPIRPYLIERPYLPKKPDCGQAIGEIESKESKLIALIDGARKKARLDLLKLSKSVTFALEFDEKEKRVVTVDLKIEEDPTEAKEEAAPQPGGVETPQHQLQMLPAEKCSFQP